MANPNTAPQSNFNQAPAPFDGAKPYVDVVTEFRMARAENAINSIDDYTDDTEWFTQDGEDGVFELLRLGAEAKADNDPDKPLSEFENNLIGYTQKKIDYYRSQSHVDMLALEGSSTGIDDNQELENLDIIMADLTAKQQDAQSRNDPLAAKDQESKIAAIDAYTQSIKLGIEPVADVAKNYVKFSELLQESNGGNTQSYIQNQLDIAKDTLANEAQQYQIHSEAMQVLAEYYPAQPAATDEVILETQQPIMLPMATNKVSNTATPKNNTTLPAAPSAISAVAPQPLAQKLHKGQNNRQPDAQVKAKSPAEVERDHRYAEEMNNAKLALDDARADLAASGAKRSGRLFTFSANKDRSTELEKTYNIALHRMGRLQIELRSGATEETKNNQVISYILEEQTRLRTETIANQKASRFNTLVRKIDSSRVAKGLAVAAATGLVVASGGTLALGAGMAAGGLAAIKLHTKSKDMQSAESSIKRSAMMDFINTYPGDRLSGAMHYGSERYQKDVEKEQKKRVITLLLGSLAVTAGGVLATAAAGSINTTGATDTLSGFFQQYQQAVYPPSPYTS